MVLSVIYSQLRDYATQTESCLLLQPVTPMLHSWTEARCIYYMFLSPDPCLVLLANIGNCTATG